MVWNNRLLSQPDVRWLSSINKRRHHDVAGAETGAHEVADRQRVRQCDAERRLQGAPRSRPVHAELDGALAEVLEANILDDDERFQMLTQALARDRLTGDEQIVLATQDDAVAAHLALAGEEGRVVALSRLQTLDVIGRLTVQELEAVGAEDGQSTTLRAVDQDRLGAGAGRLLTSSGIAGDDLSPRLLAETGTSRGVALV